MYLIGRQFVYADSNGRRQWQVLAKLRELYRVGFFDVSSDGKEVDLPVNGSLEIAHQKRPSLLRRCEDYSVDSLCLRPLSKRLFRKACAGCMPGSGLPSS